MPSRQVPLDVHRDVQHASNSRAVGGGIHVHNQVVRSDAKDAERTFERPRAKRVNARQFGSSPHVFQVALGNLAGPAFDGRPRQLPANSGNGELPCLGLDCRIKSGNDE